jgi:signal transduction histidine kinase/HAMP domain-containing protein
MSSLPRWWSSIWRRVRVWLNWRQKLRTKLLLAIVLLCMLPLSILTFLTLRMGSSYVMLDATQENHQRALRLAERVDQHFVGKLDGVRKLSPPEVRAMTLSAGSRARYFAQLLRDNPDLLSVTLFTRDGLRLDSGQREGALPALDAWSRTVAMRQADLEVGRFRYDPGMRQMTMTLSVPLSVENGQGYAYLLVLRFGMNGMVQEVLAPRIGPWDRIFLEDTDGDLVLRVPDPQGKGGEGPSGLSPRLTRFWDNSTFSVIPYLNDAGHNVLGAFARCGTLGWGVYLECSAEVPYRRLAGIRLSVLTFSGLMMLFTLAAGVWFVARLVQPLEDLEAGIRLVSSGLMGDELPIRSQDEIGRLTQTFNQMTRMLAQRTEEIRTKTRELTFFNTITRIINQSVDLNRVLEDSLQKILHLMHGTVGLIYVFQPLVKQLKLLAHSGVSDQFYSAPGHPEFIQGPVRKVYAEGASQLLRDPQRGDPALDLVRTEGLQDLLLVPLRSKKTTLGVLAVGSRRRHSFHYRDLDLLSRVGDELGVAVENALLYDELQLKIKELQEANQDLQELDRFKTRFLSNISHELRTPITSIKSYVELFLGNKIGILDALQEEKLQIVRRNVNQLLNLINDLLTLSRSDDLKGYVLQPEPVVLQELVDQVIADTIELARAKSLQLARQGLTRPVLVRADREKLRQVLQNLVGNAIKFTEKGRITVEVAAQEGGGASDPRVRVSVTDTGIGIPAEEHGKIFQRFYQVDSSSTRKYVGSGLGLAIVKEILAAHHVAIQVESALGHGTRFSFTFPVLRAEQSSEGDGGAGAGPAD